MTVEVERFGLFSYLWELTNFPNRLPVGMRDHSSWNTILQFAKLNPQDFPTDEDED
jgi:hypothetical protein